MRKLGLIGGLSWYSTELYYAHINKQVLRRTNGTCNAPLLIESLNFCDVGKASTAEDWVHVAEVLIASARRLLRYWARQMSWPKIGIVSA